MGDVRSCGQQDIFQQSFFFLNGSHPVQHRTAIMKIGLYSHSIPPSVDGVSRRMASLLQQLCKDGHEVRIAGTGSSRIVVVALSGEACFCPVLDHNTWSACHHAARLFFA